VNVVPQRRKERLAQVYREDLEKYRLRGRKEGFFHYEEGGVTPPQESIGYISEADRFITDIAAVNKVEADAAFAKRQAMYQNRRLNNAFQEEERWRTIEMRHQIEHQRLEDTRHDVSYARSNKTSMPYNPINLRYDHGIDGERLRYSDESMRYRGALRAEHLQRRGAGTPFDPITGTPVVPVRVPERPSLPPI